MNLEELDGRIGEGWSGERPNGAHVNVVLARRGSPTAAAAVSMLEGRDPDAARALVERRDSLLNPFYGGE